MDVEPGGKTVGVFGFEHTAKKSGNAPWCDAVPLAVDLDAAAKRAIAKLDPIERYALQRKGFKHKPG